ncbi:MAG: alkaline phosphatase D family protein [Pseudomonadales bacterium]
MSSRRRFLLTASGLIAATPLASAWASASGTNPFSLGVASGCPRPDRVTLWTRIAPNPLQGGGGPVGDLSVRCRVCRDPELTDTVIDTLVSAPAEDAHSVHFTARGLEPHREYFYQFYLGEDASPMGRTRTAPAEDSDVPVRLAVASCQHLEYGYYAAYADMAKAVPDLIVHLGDYIYEYAPGPLGKSSSTFNGQTIEVNRVRQHAGPELRTLWDYRNRYAQYRLDRDLQAAHAAAPWLAAFDDHEVDNNWAGYVPEDPERQTELEFRVRRWAAFKAYYEHMPLEHAPHLRGTSSSLRLYDRFDFGRQLSLLLLDTRQFRSDQPCGQAFPADDDCPQRSDPRLTMTGRSQERWLKRQLRRSDARWKVLAQQTWFSQLRYPQARYNMDQWDGYPAQRQRLQGMLADPELGNPVILSGDWHCGAAMNVLEDFSRPESAPVAAELAVTSISSPCVWAGAVSQALPENPHVRYFGGDARGYLWCNVTSEALTAQYRVVEAPERADSALRLDRALRVSAGRRGFEPA